MEYISGATIYTMEEFLSAYPSYSTVRNKKIHTRSPYVVFIAENGSVTLPEVSYYSDFWIIVAPGVAVTLYDWRTSEHNKHHKTSILVQQEAQLVYHLIDRLPEALVLQSDILLEVEKQGRCMLFALFAGQASTSYRCTFIGSGVDAQIVFRGVYLKHTNQLFAYQAEQQHSISGITTDCVLTGVAADSARISYKGRIHIAQAAARSVALQVNKNIVIGQSAQVLTDPVLEVLNNDVLCKHAAAVGSVDQALVLYLRSRGLSEKLAHNLLLQGFLHEVFIAPEAACMRPLLAESLTQVLKIPCLGLAKASKK